MTSLCPPKSVSERRYSRFGAVSFLAAAERCVLGAESSRFMSVMVTEWAFGSKAQGAPAMVFLLSCPQAASMSAPCSERISASNPAVVSTVRNLRISSALGLS